jgi:hypothetical protein
MYILFSELLFAVFISVGDRFSELATVRVLSSVRSISETSQAATHAGQQQPTMIANLSRKIRNSQFCVTQVLLLIKFQGDAVLLYCVSNQVASS